MEGCSTIEHLDGLCQTHYYRKSHGIPLDAPKQAHKLTASDKALIKRLYPVTNAVTVAAILQVHVNTVHTWARQLNVRHSDTSPASALLTTTIAHSVGMLPHAVRNWIDDGLLLARKTDSNTYVIDRIAFHAFLVENTYIFYGAHCADTDLGHEIVAVVETRPWIDAVEAANTVDLPTATPAAVTTLLLRENVDFDHAVHVYNNKPWFRRDVIDQIRRDTDYASCSIEISDAFRRD